jgi:putative transposase
VKSSKSIVRPLYLFTCKTGLMLRMFRVLSAVLLQFFRSRRDLLLENLALRQQPAVLRARHPQPRFSASDRLFWVILRRLWLGWKQALILVQPETVVRWHRAGFKVYWTWISRHRSRAGRTCVSRELREIIFRMVAENSTWGAPRIHGELKMLGFDISERTVLRWMRKAPRNPEPAKRWAAFLTNHREAIAAMDFFTVPTLNFGILYCFFVIAHDRRQVLHCNVTKHPTSAWVIQQLREAFPFDSAPAYLIFDRGASFNEEVIATVKSFGIQPKRTSFRSPWQTASQSVGLATAAEISSTT